MATQDDSGIRFSFAHTQQGFRLLELPPALLEIISSEEPPILSLKSNSSSGPAIAESSSHAVLCTQDKTYHMRQVHSSNSIFLIRPAPATGDSLDDAIGSGQSVQVTGSSKATLELLPASPPTRALLRPLLSPYHGFQEDEDDFETMPSFARKIPRTRTEISSDVPTSNEELSRAWRELCAFEHAGQSWIPAASALARVWRDIIDSAALSGIRLSSEFNSSDVWKSMRDFDHPQALYEAVLSRIAPDSRLSPDQYRTIEKSKCVSWVGLILLETRTEKGDLDTREFKDLWANQLPEEWRGDVTLEVIKGKYILPTPSTIRFDRDAAERDESNERPDGGADKSAVKSRKWHDKFRAAGKK